MIVMPEELGVIDSQSRQVIPVGIGAYLPPSWAEKSKVPLAYEGRVAVVLFNLLPFRDRG